MCARIVANKWIVVAGRAVKATAAMAAKGVAGHSTLEIPVKASLLLQSVSLKNLVSLPGRSV
jgi:hypothetical protein